MSNLFTKARIKSTLDAKIASGEIKFYSLNKTSLHIKKSKRCKTTLDISGLSDDVIVRLISKKIPDPSIINIESFYKRELRDLKIGKLFS